MALPNECGISESFGPTESSLGVAVNRNIQKEEMLAGTTRVYYNDTGGTATIDIENDPLFQEFLRKVRENKTEGEPLVVAERAVELVVALTPDIDESGERHFNRAVLLGEALSAPVECVDRALAYEAVLKMLGVTNDAKMLISIDRFPNGSSANHTDVIFSADGKTYVAITTGERAGQVLPYEEYSTIYLKEREDRGLGKREIKPDWGREYFCRVDH